MVSTFVVCGFDTNNDNLTKETAPLKFFRGVDTFGGDVNVSVITFRGLDLTFLFLLQSDVCIQCDSATERSCVQPDGNAMGRYCDRPSNRTCFSRVFGE
jgi:hypothetical protein